MTCPTLACRSATNELVVGCGNDGGWSYGLGANAADRLNRNSPMAARTAADAVDMNATDVYATVQPLCTVGRWKHVLSHSPRSWTIPERVWTLYSTRIDHQRASGDIVVVRVRCGSRAGVCVRRRPGADAERAMVNAAVVAAGSDAASGRRFPSSLVIRVIAGIRGLLCVCWGRSRCGRFSGRGRRGHRNEAERTRWREQL